MTFQAFLYSVLTGLSFGIWPLISRVAGLSTIWTSITITIGTAVVVSFCISQEPHLPPAKNLMLGLSAGLLSGVGLLTYGKLISNSNVWNMSITIPISLIITPMVIILGGWLFFGDQMTTTKGLGGILGIVAIYMMCK
ncbi:MAG: EamA family transporter [Candidatus Moraniibacteriota bacterium]